ncbi:hypothetical protein DN30_3595 [Vibrio cholerae]|nr:hypothetical protein DN30_3595 [Vibrio cholerae]
MSHTLLQRIRARRHQISKALTHTKEVLREFTKASQ